MDQLSPSMHYEEGRISKQAYMGSVSAFLAVCLVVCAIRCHIRFFVIRKFGWDDGLLIFGVCCLITGVTLSFTVIDHLYEIQNVMFGNGIIAFIADPKKAESFGYDSAHSRTVISIALSFMWLTLCCVKYCFLAFFKTLLRQMPRMTKFWWFAVVFNGIASTYGFLTFYVACPFAKIDDMSTGTKCSTRIFSFSWPQMATDIVGDALILIIPCILIWQIRVSWTQKIALAFTLCLTIVVVILTVIRITGLSNQGKANAIWETWCIAISAEVGMSLVGVSAFRALYVAKARNRRVNRTIRSFGWYNKGLSIFRRITNTHAARPDDEKKGDTKLENDIPRGTMTGMRIFIDGNGRTRLDETTDEMSG